MTLRIKSHIAWAIFRFLCFIWRNEQEFLGAMEQWLKYQWYRAAWPFPMDQYKFCDAGPKRYGRDGKLVRTAPFYTGKCEHHCCKPTKHYWKRMIKAAIQWNF